MTDYFDVKKANKKIVLLFKVLKINQIIDIINPSPPSMMAVKRLENWLLKTSN
jgi:hypothetical protein